MDLVNGSLREKLCSEHDGVCSVLAVLHDDPHFAVLIEEHRNQPRPHLLDLSLDIENIILVGDEPTSISIHKGQTRSGE
jgi:hypothetical protein